MFYIPERYNATVMLDANLEAGRGNKVAIYFGEERVTYSDLFARVCSMGRTFKELGVMREQRVLLLLGDTPAFPVAFLGAMRIGAIPVPVNPLYRTEDYRYFLEDSDARVVVADEPFLDKLKSALKDYPEAVTVISTGSQQADVYHLSELLSAHSGEVALANTHRDDMAFWLYSSGSTGKPKGVVHLHHDIPYTFETYARNVLGINEADVIFARVLFHAYPLGAAISFAYSAGASTVLYSGRPTPEAMLETIVRFRPTLFFSVPTLYSAILNYPAAAQYKLDSLRLCISAAEPLAPEIWRRWQETFGVTILDGIGSTEMLHIFCSNTLDALKPGSSGKPVPGYELRILDLAGNPVPPGGQGDLLVKGDSAAPFYWHQHAKSVRTMLGEWVVTGDLYHMDDEGFYWYSGRSDDMIKLGGEWVSPIEIENRLLEHPAVQEVGVVGVQVEGIMRIKAVMILTGAYTGSADLIRDLQGWCKERLQRYQYPHVIEFVSELPKTMTGKLQRYKLR